MAPRPLTGKQTIAKLNESLKDGDEVIGSIKRRTIFSELPYWESLYVWNNLDVMHVEKNVADAIISTSLNVPRKSNENLNARLDMVNMGIKTQWGRS